MYCSGREDIAVLRVSGAWAVAFASIPEFECTSTLSGGVMLCMAEGHASSEFMDRKIN